MSGILEIDGLSVQLGDEAVVQDVSLTVAPGEVLAIVGPNGAGKSSLLRAVAGLVPAASGCIRLYDQPLDDLSADMRAPLMSYLPQTGEVHWPLLVEKLVALGAFARGIPPDAATVEQALREVDAWHLRGRGAFDLSGGERARVLLARALAVQAAVLLADEPVSALDPAHQIMVMELFRKQASGGRSTIVVLHDLLLAARYADRVALMDGGKLVAMGKPGDVLSEAHMDKVYGVSVRQVGAGGPLVPWNRI